MDDYINQTTTVEILRKQEAHNWEGELQARKRRLLDLQIKEMELKFPEEIRGILIYLM